MTVQIGTSTWNLRWMQRWTAEHRAAPPLAVSDSLQCTPWPRNVRPWDVGWKFETLRSLQGPIASMIGRCCETRMAFETGNTVEWWWSASYSFYSHSKIGVESVSTCIFGSPGPGSCSFAIDDKLHDVSDIDGVRQCTPANLAKWSECSQDPWVLQAPEDSHLQNSTGIEKMTCFSFFFKHVFSIIFIFSSCSFYISFIIRSYFFHNSFFHICVIILSYGFHISYILFLLQFSLFFKFLACFF